jgi:hypothetical protein
MDRIVLRLPAIGRDASSSSFSEALLLLLLLVVAAVVSSFASSSITTTITTTTTTTISITTIVVAIVSLLLPLYAIVRRRIRLRRRVNAGECHVEHIVEITPLGVMLYSEFVVDDDDAPASATPHVDNNIDDAISHRGGKGGGGVVVGATTRRKRGRNRRRRRNHHRAYIPKSCILDVVVMEVVRSHRVYSSVVFRVSTDVDCGGRASSSSNDECGRECDDDNDYYVYDDDANREDAPDERRRRDVLRECIARRRRVSIVHAFEPLGRYDDNDECFAYETCLRLRDEISALLLHPPSSPHSSAPPWTKGG